MKFLCCFLFLALISVPGFGQQLDPPPGSVVPSAAQPSAATGQGLVPSDPAAAAAASQPGAVFPAPQTNSGSGDSDKEKSDSPNGSDIEITSDGGTRYEGGIAYAEDNVVIYTNGSTLYADEAQYNPRTKDIFLKGHVKIYQDKLVFSGESSLYNLTTKNLRASDFMGYFQPFRFQGDNLYTLEGGGYGIKNGFFTTHDSSKPDYRLRARTVRIYPDDRIVFSNVTLFVGKTPIFWFPYLYQSLNDTNVFLITPGYSSKLGAYLLTSYTFPIIGGPNGKLSGELHLDLLSERGVAGGVDLNYVIGKDQKAQPDVAADTDHPRSWGKIKSYVINDSSTNINTTSLTRPSVSTERYRLGWQSKLYVTDDWSATIDVTKLSDSKFLEDFFPTENRLDPQPDALVALTKSSENYTLTALARGQINDFQQTTERLPEVALDVKRTPIFNTGIFYEGETSIGQLGRRNPDTSTRLDFRTTRADTFHQLTYPGTYFGWLSLVPRAGFRATYYDPAGSLTTRLPDSSLATIATYNAVILSRQQTVAANNAKIEDLRGQQVGATPTEVASLQIQIDDLETANEEQATSIAALQTTVTNVSNGKQTVDVLTETGSNIRTVFNLGLEASFKFSRVFPSVQTRTLGLDGLLHVVQPYANFSYVSEPSLKPSQLLPIDTYIPSTQLAPIDFPQFVALDSIDQTTVLRLGLRNRLLTKRNDRSYAWMELDTFFDVNIENPFDSSDYSNLFNRFRFNPVPWASLALDSQLPVFDEGFTEINTTANFMASRDLSFNVGHRYLQNNPFFIDSSLLTFAAYYQLDENWAFSVREQYEYQDAVLESQRYTLHRDLTSWVASLSAILRDNRGGKQEVAFYISFTLKDLPSLNLNLNLDPSSSGQE